jgi:sterol desaturase/sphingolipid hydroxylase (fatty acid hydroxylase superfamily)
MDIEKILTWGFIVVLLLMAILFSVHEYGHYLAYKILRIPAKFRRSLFAPGIDPKETVLIQRWQGIMIAFGGLVLSLVIIVPLFIFSYKHSFVILIGAIAGSVVDFIWALSMVGRKTVTINSRD